MCVSKVACLLCLISLTHGRTAFVKNDRRSLANNFFGALTQLRKIVQSLTIKDDVQELKITLLKYWWDCRYSRQKKILVSFADESEDKFDGE